MRLRLLLAVGLLAIVARLTVLALLLPPSGLYHQEPSLVAANINAGRGFVYEQYGTLHYAWKEPGHIAVLALVTRWFGNGALPILVLQWSCGVAVALAGASLARRITGDSMAAIIAGALIAVNPFLVYYDSLLVHSLSLDTLLFVLVVILTLKAVEDPRLTWWSAGLAGLMTGVGVWQRATVLFCGAAMWGMRVLAARGVRARELARAALYLAVALALIAPWFARNHAVVGRWVLTTDIAHIIWLGNNPLSNGTYSDARGTRLYYKTDPAFRASIEGRTELEQADAFLTAARSFVREHPAQALGLGLRRVWGFVWFPPNAGVEYKAWQIGVYSVVYVGMVALGIAGAMRLWRRSEGRARRRAGLAASSLLGLVAIHFATAINTRHRVPLEMILAVFAAVALADAVRWWRRTPPPPSSYSRVDGRLRRPGD